MKKSLNHSELKREIGLFTATALVVANMVGTGIFTTSGFVMQELGSPQAMLLCWVAGGVFALCGALCYGELGARFPKAGGEYIFLRESFGPSMGFLAGWISLIVGFSAPIAAAAIAFSIYLFQALGIPQGDPAVFSIGNIQLFHMSPNVLVAMVMVISISVLHFHSLRIGSRVQNVLTLFKVVLIVLFVGAGLLSRTGNVEHFSIVAKPDGGLAERFAVSLIFISFAYSGWNAAAYLGGEIKRPGRTIPFALFFGALFVTILYILLNIVYIYALTPEQMKGAVDVGARAAVSLFGPGISRVVSAAIALGLLSVLSAMILTGPRVYYAMSKDRLFFDLFSKVSRTRHTPAHSIFLQATIAIIMVATASYDILLLYIGFTLSLVALLTVAGMIRLRFKSPLEKPGYMTFGYPITPLLFIIGNIWIIYFSISSRPVPALASLLTIVVGMGVYFLFERHRKRVHPDFSEVDTYFLVNARTHKIDQTLQKMAAEGLGQVVVLGAGFDTRAYRFAEKMPSIKFFELDLPATLQRKKEMVEDAIGKVPAYVAYAPIDFNTETIEEALVRVGYDPAKKTFFVWEGVTMYITKEAVDRTLRFIAAHSVPGSTVIVDYIPEQALKGDSKKYPGVRRIVFRMALAGEPVISGLPEGVDAIETYMNSRGLAVLSIVGYEELTRMYLIGSDGRPDGQPSRYFRIVHAKVPGPGTKIANSETESAAPASAKPAKKD